MGQRKSSLERKRRAAAQLERERQANVLKRKFMPLEPVAGTENRKPSVTPEPPSVEPATGRPTNPHPENEESPFQQFWAFVLTWTTLGAVAGIGVGWLWNRYIEETAFAPYIIASALCFCSFAACHKVFPKGDLLKRRLLPLAIAVVILGGVYFLENGRGSGRRSDSATENTATTARDGWPQPITFIITNVFPSHPSTPQFIEGTGFTHAALTNQFPFGYVLFFWGDGGIRPEPHMRELDTRQQWDVDWSKVKITPDFEEGTVLFELPEIGFHALKNGVKTRTGMGNRLGPFRVKMTVGFAHINRGVYGGNEPMMWVATLSNNQRNPVFAIGFRIDDTKAR